jgi:uncharacterized protein YjbI with pentapeptide repeats
MAQQEHVDKLREGAQAFNAWRAALTAASGFFVPDLSGASFEGARLSGVDLYRANLQGCSFKGCNLTEAKLNEADCRKSDFSNASMHLSKAASANFSDANLSDAILHCANFSNVKFVGANLTSCWASKWRDARFTAWMTDFTNANLTDTRFSYAIFREAVFTNALIEGALFGGDASDDVQFLDSHGHQLDIRSCGIFSTCRGKSRWP